VSGRGSPARYDRKTQPGSAGAGLGRVGRPHPKVGGQGGPCLGLEGDVEGLAALHPPEADQRPLEVEVLEPESGTSEFRDDRPVVRVERSLSEAASFERPDIVSRALRRRLLGREERVDGLPPARPRKGLTARRPSLLRQIASERKGRTSPLRWAIRLSRHSATRVTFQIRDLAAR